MTVSENDSFTAKRLRFSRRLDWTISWNTPGGGVLHYATIRGCAPDLGGFGTKSL